MMIFIVLVITLINSQTTAPMWEKKWQADFDEQNVEKTSVTWLRGRMFYDYDNLQYRIDRDNGRSDNFCGTTYDKNTPCSHIVKDNKRYLFFPNIGKCCYCCDAEHGCGVLTPDWAADSEYLENIVDIRGQTVEKWSKQGLQPNFIYQTPDTKRNTQIDQSPNNFLYFILSTYSVDVDPLVFDLPEICEQANNCDGLSYCQKFRGNLEY